MGLKPNPFESVSPASLGRHKAGKPSPWLLVDDCMHISSCRGPTGRKKTHSYAVSDAQLGSLNSQIQKLTVLILVAVHGPQVKPADFPIVTVAAKDLNITIQLAVVSCMQYLPHQPNTVCVWLQLLKKAVMFQGMRHDASGDMLLQQCSRPQLKQTQSNY